MKYLYILFLFLSFFGLTFSDYFITSISPGLTQSLFILPFIGFSFFYFKKEINSLFLKLIFFYILIGSIFFVLYGFRNLELLSNLIGCVLVGLPFYNYRLKYLYQKYAFNIFILFSFYFCFMFYLGFWEISNVGRATFMKHNENYLAQILNIGLVFSLLKYIYSTTRKSSRVFLFLTIFHIIPILATVSRTGITLMLFALILLLWHKFDQKVRYILFVFFSFSILLVGTFFAQLVNKNDFLRLYFERTSESKEDERFDLWNISYDLALNNLFTGTGFDKFYDFDWRKSVGLYYEQFDDLTNTLQTGFMSVHNSFIDLVLIGGIWLLFSFLLLIYFPIIKGIKLFYKSNYKIHGAFILVLIFNVILFSFTGQGATQKITWFLLGICYLEIDNSKKIIV